MPIQSARIRSDVEAIAKCTATPGAGASRPTFSPAWREAVDYVVSELQKCGCFTRIDAAGNVHARPAGLSWDASAWMSGSHLDSVPGGGDYDGVAGVVVPLEVLRTAYESGRDDCPLELVIFAEEEGTTFGLGMVGSRAYSGGLDADDLGRIVNSEGATYLEAGAPHGVDAHALSTDRIRTETLHGFIEVHPEQGPRLWRHGRPLAVVTGIAGRRQYRIQLHGRTNHAGSTAMSDRQDALVGAAFVILQLEAMAHDFSADTVITVGQIECRPNAVNVIPGDAHFTIDFRSPDNRVLNEGHEHIQQLVHATAGRRGLIADIQATESLAACSLDGGLCARLTTAATRCGHGPLPETTSGALHDAAILAPHVPTAMLFVASRDGVSHNPAEFSRIEDLSAAAEILWELIAGGGQESELIAGGGQESVPISLHDLNELDRPGFIAVVGPAFEHSSWIAERTWPQRPFASIEALHGALRRTLEVAMLDEQVRLIQAHPDLVGRAARSGTLTPESAREQTGAGLGDLSDDETARFQAYNAAYRERFGFPFVICARENKKESILAAFPKRLEHDREQEIATALDEISKIALFRLKDVVTEPQFSP